MANPAFLDTYLAVENVISYLLNPLTILIKIYNKYKFFFWNDSSNKLDFPEYIPSTSTQVSLSYYRCGIALV